MLGTGLTGKRFPGRAIAITAAAVCCAVAAAPAAAADWRQDRFGPGQTGVNPFEWTLSPTTVSGLVRGFARPTGGPIVWSSPAVAAGRLFVGAEDGKVYALDATTGTVRWTRTIGGFVFASPTVAGGRVFIGADESDGRFYALDAATGAIVWSRPLGGLRASPTFANGTLFVANTDAHVFALDPATGATRWDFDEPDDANIGSSPAVAGGRVVVAANVGTARARVTALDAASGSRLWRFELTHESSQIAGAPAVVGGLVFFATLDRRIFAISAATGKRVWRAYMAGPGVASVAVAGGIAYTSFVDPGGATCSATVVARSAASGAFVWRRLAASGTGCSWSYRHSSPIVANGVVYVGGPDGEGTVAALRASDGTPLAAVRTGGPVLSDPTVVNGRLYAAGAAGVTMFRLP